jgi:hypothetical protein
MLLTTCPAPGTENRWLRAAVILFRAVFGLVLHAVTKPGVPAVIDRTTGKVAAR